MGDNSTYVNRAKGVFTPNYQPAPLVIDRGEGCYVWDVEGRRYLDMVAGIAVSALGHAHPALVEAIRAQAGKLLHTSNLFLNRPAVELAEKLVQQTFADQIFFCSSGAEANEAAIKLARRYAFSKGEKDRHRILSFDRSFHGRTMGALTATAQPKYHEGFAPLVPGFEYLPYGDIEALERAMGPQVAAILLEPIQGEGGVRSAPPGFLAACRRLADQHGALLILDEVQTGFGRTGKLFAHEHEGVTPDIMAMAKGIGGGLPLGAIATKKEVGAALVVGTHGTTYGGNPVACAAGNVIIDTVSQPAFLSRVESIGQRLMEGLRRLNGKHGAFAEVRGRGLIVGAEIRSGLGFQAKEVVAACRGRGVLIHVAGPEVLRLVPPLILGEAEVDECLSAMDGALAELMPKERTISL